MAESAGERRIMNRKPSRITISFQEEYQAQGTGTIAPCPFLMRVLKGCCLKMPRKKHAYLWRPNAFPLYMTSHSLIKEQ
ncbi:conserved hypothetical protein [Ricinus communis]|uniref:Uncharacterized protein n=1 Tax=Ricinus communis TaxID=3988 RepID=B9S6I1_RICCO|nr:conserved hypothetical protein [Ricinus communis]